MFSCARLPPKSRRRAAGLYAPGGRVSLHRGRLSPLSIQTLERLICVSRHQRLGASVTIEYDVGFLQQALGTTILAAEEQALSQGKAGLGRAPVLRAELVTTGEQRAL